MIVKEQVSGSNITAWGNVEWEATIIREHSAPDGWEVEEIVVREFAMYLIDGSTITISNPPSGRMKVAVEGGSTDELPLGSLSALMQMAAESVNPIQVIRRYFELHS